MAKIVKTRESQYREILAKCGIRIEDCRILSFVFKQERRPELFHFGLMFNDAVYYLFECWGKYANVVVPKDEQNASIIIGLAKRDGGELTTSILR